MFNKIFSKPCHSASRFATWRVALLERTPSILASPKRVVNEGNDADSSKFMYFVEIICPSQTKNLTTSELVMQPQPLCYHGWNSFTIGTTHSGLNASPTRRRIKVTQGVLNIWNKERNIKFRKNL